MKLKWTFFIPMLVIAGINCGWERPSKALVRLNNHPVPLEAQFFNTTDDGCIEAFKNYSFVCRNQEDFSPKESDQAKKEFDAFRAYLSAHPDPTIEEKKHRLSLLGKAVAAGGWRAKFFDLMWEMWDERANAQALEPLSRRLIEMVNEGIPVALVEYVEWTESNMDPNEKYRLLKIAIDRGSPQAMSRVGWNLGMRSPQLRPMAKQMLDCAASQGDPDAYHGLGEIARREGHFVDAYRLWEKGANMGSDRCLDKLESFSELEPESGLKYSTGVMEKLRVIREFYNEQWVYQRTRMYETLEKLPPDKEFHATDVQIIKLIKLHLESERRSLP